MRHVVAQSKMVLSIAALGAMASLPIGAAWAGSLTVANFGGANAKAQVEAFQKPFTQRHGDTVSAVEYTGDLESIRTMVKDGKVQWDVAEVESTDLLAGCEAGLFEKIDRTQINNVNQLLPGSVHECGVGAFMWSTVMAYDPSRFKDAPKGWADFWDVTKYPGKRGMRKGARYNLEFALMADGVKRADVYALLATEEGVERALRKLQALMPHIVWWESGSQPPKMLSSGEVVMSTAFNGRVAVANQTAGAARLEINWLDAIYEFDYWVVVKGTPNRDLAQKYINFAISEEAQLAFSKEISYGPTNYNAILKYDAKRSSTRSSTMGHQSLVDLSMISSDLPSAPGNSRKALPFNAAFWIKRGPAIEKRFSAAK